MPKSETNETRTKSSNVKRQIIRERNCIHLELLHAEVAEFEYTPHACDRAYQMVKEHCLDLEVVGNIDNSSRAETRGTTSSRREATADDGVRNVSSVFIRVPCRIIRHARQTIHRLLKWVDYTPSFFRLCGILNPQEESPTWKRVGERASASWVQLKLQFDRFNFRDESQVVVGEERSDHVLAQVVNSLHPTTTNQRSSVPCSEDFFGKFYGIESIACRINPAFIQQAI